MVNTRRTAPRAALAFALLAAFAAIVVTAAVADDGALTVGKTSVTASWRQGWLRPGALVRFSGSVAAPSTITAVLRPVAHPGVVTAKEDYQVEQGPFSETLRLPARPLPGKYTLQIRGMSDAMTLEPVQRIIVMPAPPEGVLDRASVGVTKTGPWLGYAVNTPPVLKGEHPIVWMRFRFLAPPTGRQVELVWKYKWHIVVGRVYKRYKDTLLTYAKTSSGEPMAHGHWNVVLKIGGRVAKQMDVVLK
jgi:hypothetical protein